MIRKRPQINTISLQVRRVTKVCCARLRLPHVLLLLIASLSVFLTACSPDPTESTVEDLRYLGWDHLGLVQLYKIDSANKPVQLTHFGTSVLDFAPSPDGYHIALSTMGDDGGSDLWLMERDGSTPRRLYGCPGVECSNLSWAPDSRRLLFEQREVDGDGAAQTPVLWWLDTETSSVLPVLEDNSLHGAFGSLSPDGQWLSYHSPEKEGMYVYNLEDGSSQFIVNEIGTRAVWGPSGRHLLLPVLDLLIVHGDEGEDHQAHEHDYQTAVHLMRFDVNSGEQLMLGGDLSVEDGAPAWSPDGAWIAFGRRAPGTGAARQLWIMRDDGSEARAVADDPAINHGPPTWSADGRYLLFQQISQDDLAASPSIWRLDVETGEKEQLVISGMQPSWLAPSP